MGIQLASFPNSRIKPRPARTQGQTPIKTVPTGAPFKLANANINRTNLMLRNMSPDFILWYGYSNLVNGTTIGFELKPQDSVTLDDPGEVWSFQSSGGNISVCVDEGEG